MSIAAGLRNRRVAIERSVAGDDGQGGQIEAWVTIGTPWVSARPIAGKEGLIAGTLRTTQPWRIEMPFRRDLLPSDRLRATWLIGPQLLSIVSIADPTGKREELVLMCETEVA